MIKPEPLHMWMEKVDFVPQAMISETVFDVAKRTGLEVEKGADDLDEYFGAAALLDGRPFAVMHYRGHPDDTSTIYLPFDLRDVDEISRLVARIAAELKLAAGAIIWQRKDNPDL